MYYKYVSHDFKESKSIIVLLVKQNMKTKRKMNAILIIKEENTCNVMQDPNGRGKIIHFGLQMIVVCTHTRLC